MSQETGRSAEREKRKELPIERGFPIERINEIAQKESRAKQWYRPISMMHKWWARRLGCVFRSISLYSLLDDPKKVEVYEPGENGTLRDFGGGHDDIENLIKNVDMTDPEALWELYPKDVRINDKKILDPFMGGGTSLVEASRFGVEASGYDINPVAWFTTKKELEAGKTDIAELEASFEQVKEEVSDEILDYYKTPCPNGDHDADAMYTFWVKELKCVSCDSTVPLHKDYRVAKGRYENDDKYNVHCPSCDAVFHVDDWHEETSCPDCDHEFNPERGNSDRAGNYTCSECGQKYRIIDYMRETGEFDTQPYAVEYHCRVCEENESLGKSDVKGYKAISNEDIERIERAKEELERNSELGEYLPSQSIPEGAVSQPSDYDNYDLYGHGYDEWTDLFGPRSLVCLSKLLKTIDKVENQNHKEFLLLAFSDSLMFQNSFSIYNVQRHSNEGIFKTNSFSPQNDFVENNVWGAEFGRGTFEKTWEKLLRGVEYASSPTERYIKDGETKETPPFSKPIGENTTVTQGDMRNIDSENEFDAVITDPPYYDNVMYSELSNFFYVWQRLLLQDTYDAFETEHTPRTESIVANPADGKGPEEFEEELQDAFSVIHKALKDDGVLSFTYHHSDSESWGELLESLCDAGFEVTAAYPISADLNRLIQGEAVSFDIVIVARPTESREPISWNSLRRNIYRTAQRTHKQLEENRDLARGDIGVIEMGECFHEYSKHHGKVMRAGEEMTAKEVVKEIYGVIQEGSDIGEIDVFLDLLETPNATYDDLNKLTRGTNASPEQMEDLRLYRIENGSFILGTWDDEKRMAYIQQRVNGDGDNGLNALDKAQFLRYNYEQGKSTQNYLSKWGVDDELRELCEGLAEATDDDVYQRVLGGDQALGNY